MVGRSKTRNFAKVSASFKIFGEPRIPIRVIMIIVKPIILVRESNIFHEPDQIKIL